MTTSLMVGLAIVLTLNFSKQISDNDTFGIIINTFGLFAYMFLLLGGAF